MGLTRAWTEEADAVIGLSLLFVLLSGRIEWNTYSPILTDWNASMKHKTKVALWADLWRCCYYTITTITHRCVLGVTCNKPIRVPSSISSQRIWTSPVDILTARSSHVHFCKANLTHSPWYAVLWAFRSGICRVSGAIAFWITKIAPCIICPYIDRVKWTCSKH